MMEILNSYSIESLYEIDIGGDKFGNKATNLSNTFQNIEQINILDGLCFSIPQNVIEKFINDLPIIFNKMKNIIFDKQEKLIIRSSTKKEDGACKSYAGYFESVTCDNEYNDFLNKLKLIIQDQSREEVISFFIQEYLNCEKGGVAFVLDEEKIFLEIANSANEVVNGKVEDAILIVDANRNYPKILDPLLKKFRDIFKFYQRPIDIEWGYYDKKFYIFQVRIITKEIGGFINEFI